MIESNINDNFVVGIKVGTIGKTGEQGKSAYEVALSNGFAGTESEWIESLKGSTGENGRDGIDGADGVAVNGRDGIDGADGADGIDGKDGALITGTSYVKIADKTIITIHGNFSNAPFSFEVKDGTGAGDMSAFTYDSNHTGVVDNSELVNGLTVETAVPIGAVFTDTVYDDTDVRSLISSNDSDILNNANSISTNANNITINDLKSSVKIQDHLTLSKYIDKTTSSEFKLYIDNGKIIMEEL